MADFTASAPISLEPDQTGEAACARGTPIGVEARIAEGAQPATVNRVYARGSQTDTRQLVDIRHEASRVATCNERRGSRRMLREECIAHFGPDLECCRPDRRPQPHQQFIGRYRQRFERRLEHTTSQPAPASVSRGDPGRGMITEKYRQAVRSQYRTGQTRRLAPASIGSHAISWSGLDSDTRMHLLQPDWLATEHVLKMLAIPGHRGRLITDVITQIEAVERSATDAALPRGHTGANAGRSRPFRHEPVTAPRTHPTKASRSCCSSVSSQTKSSGNGDSHFILCPVTG